MAKRAFLMGSQHRLRMARAMERREKPRKEIEDSRADSDGRTACGTIRWLVRRLGTPVSLGAGEPRTRPTSRLARDQGCAAARFLRRSIRSEPPWASSPHARRAWRSPRREQQTDGGPCHACQPRIKRGTRQQVSRRAQRAAYCASRRADVGTNCDRLCVKRNKSTSLRATGQSPPRTPLRHNRPLQATGRGTLMDCSCLCAGSPTSTVKVQARRRFALFSQSSTPSPSPLSPTRARVPARRIGRVAPRGDAADLMLPLRAAMLPRRGAV